MERIYAAFNSWMEKYKANLTEMGGRLEPTGRTLAQDGGAMRVTDGPFPESKEFALACGFPAHAINGHWLALNVSSDAKVPTLKLGEKDAVEAK